MYHYKKRIFQVQLDSQYKGTLQVQVLCIIGIRPIENALIQVFSSEDPDNLILALETDLSGLTPDIELSSPPLIYSMQLSDNKPYADYNLKVTAPGFKTVIINGIHIFPNVKSIQKVIMYVIDETSEDIVINLQPHSLYGIYPIKTEEPQLKEVDETRPVVIPDYITVHDGPPSDFQATNYYTHYKDYIKNIVANEIYPTWPTQTIYAIILSLLSFTLNRIYTKWYPNQGYNFDITSSIAFDNLWVPTANTYLNTNIAVDYIFNQYLSRPDIIQPILTPSCKGELTTCDQMLSKWGSKILGDQGYSALNILQYYFGDSLYINASNEFAGIPYIFPGEDLTAGATGESVIQMQNQLNTIAIVFPAIPRVQVTGIYDEATTSAVIAYQEIFALPVSGIIDFATWYSISYLYVKISENTLSCF